jgi:acyl carrier protein
VTQEEIFGKVKDLVSKQLSIDEKEITSDASFIEDLGADSLDTVELIMSLEEEFDIEIPDEEAEKIKTVQNVVDYILNHLASGAKEKAS